MKYIESLQEGMRISEVYLCKSKQIAVTKTGKEYGRLMLQDKTGTVDAKIWNLNSPGVGSFEAMDYVRIDGDVSVFMGANQLNIERIRRADEGEYVAENYLPVSTKNVEEMYKNLSSLIFSIKNPYFAKAYPMLNRDLLLTAAIFHDIGKIKELSAFPENDYTDDGQLLGHIMIGTEMVSDRIRRISGFPPQLAAELKHCILAHHGELEYGSPKKPAILEALALNFADNTDAKMETNIETLRGAGNNTGWLGYNRLLETNIRRTTEE